MTTRATCSGPQRPLERESQDDVITITGKDGSRCTDDRHFELILGMAGTANRPQSCGSSLHPNNGAIVAVTEYTAVVDPMLLAMAGIMPAEGTVTIPADGESIWMTALNNHGYRRLRRA